MKGLSAKVFRTYNASITFQNQLDEGTPENGTLQEKLNHYNHGNRMVAILCNHQRAAPKTHDQSMAKMKERVWDDYPSIDKLCSNSTGYSSVGSSTIA
jgi:DNA topoisomerase I